MAKKNGKKFSSDIYIQNNVTKNSQKSQITVKDNQIIDYILDTSVVLHNPECFGTFKEHNIVLSMTVLEELDKKKSEKNEYSLVKYSAREAIRQLESIRQNGKDEQGHYFLGEGLGKLKVITKKAENSDFLLKEGINDNEILLSAYDFMQHHNKVILLSKDGNFRFKADCLGFEVQDYINDQVKDTSLLSNKIFKVSKAELQTLQSIQNNAFVYAPEDNDQDIYRWNENKMIKFNRYHYSPCYNITMQNLEQACALNILMDPNIKFVSLTGLAGTGKTFIALAAAIAQSEKNMENGYHNILVARPMVELSDKTMGYQPGNVDEKIDPYMYPLYDNAAAIKEYTSCGKSQKFKNKNQDSCPDPEEEFNFLKKWLKKERVSITPLNFIRGRSLRNTLLIVDEAQNLTPHEVKTIATRCGENSKIIFTGDIQQIDNPYLHEKSNGLSYFIEKMHGQSLHAHVELIEGKRSKAAELAAQLL